MTRRSHSASRTACSRKEGSIPRDQLEHYLHWYRDGERSSTGTSGNKTRAALELYERSRATWCGPAADYADGNGSISRLAPGPMRYPAKHAPAIELAAASSRTLADKLHNARAILGDYRREGDKLWGSRIDREPDQLATAGPAPPS